MSISLTVTANNLMELTEQVKTVLTKLEGRVVIPNLQTHAAKMIVEENVEEILNPPKVKPVSKKMEKTATEMEKVSLTTPPKKAKTTLEKLKERNPEWNLDNIPDFRPVFPKVDLGSQHDVKTPPTQMELALEEEPLKTESAEDVFADLTSAKQVAAKSMTLEEVRNATNAVLHTRKKDGNDGVVQIQQILAGFKAKRLTDLKPADYFAFVEKCTSLVG